MGRGCHESRFYAGGEIVGDAGEDLAVELPDPRLSTSGVYIGGSDSESQSIRCDSICFGLDYKHPSWVIAFGLVNASGLGFRLR